MRLYLESTIEEMFANINSSGEGNSTDEVEYAKVVNWFESGGKKWKPSEKQIEIM